MSKKIVALLLVLALCLTSVVALAADSKTSDDTNTVTPAKKTTTTTKKTTTTEPEAEIKTTAPTAEIKAELEEIAAFVNDGKAIVEYFDADVQQEIEGALPAGTDDKTIKMDEYIPLSVSGKASGSTTVSVGTAATYNKDDVVVTMISYMVDGKKVWKVVPCTVENGKLVVTLSSDIVAQLADGSGALMILSNK